jgi:SAM-dependent methyltransferase
MDPIAYPSYIARFYDLIYHQVRDGVDTNFFIRELSIVKGPALEIGVGTGRFFKEALQQGVNLFGIDSSKNMTDILLKKIDKKDHFRIKTGDAVTMKWDLKFDLVIAPFRMLSHIIEVDDQIRLLDNISEHLTEKGRFIFDVFVPDPALLAHGMHDQLDFDGEYAPGKKLRRWVSSVPDLVNQHLKVTMKLQWDEYLQTREESWDFTMRFFYRYELEHLIRLSALKLEAAYGDYHYNALDTNSKDFVMVCRRKDQ